MNELRLGRFCSVSAGFIALALLSLYLWGPPLLGPILLAAICHEAGHILVARGLGVPAAHLRLTAFGAELTLAPVVVTSFLQDIVLSLSGPAVNLLAAAVLAHLNRWPMLLGANLLLGAFNLLPVRPLDGGNALFALLSLLAGDRRSELTLEALSLAVAVAVCALGALVFWQDRRKLQLLLLGAWLLSERMRGGACIFTRVPIK